MEESGTWKTLDWKFEVGCLSCIVLVGGFFLGAGIVVIMFIY